jgi:hypothetical protein
MNDPAITLLVCASLLTALGLVYLSDLDEAVRHLRKWWGEDE